MNNTYQKRKYTHQPLTVNHLGTTVVIKENGLVIISRPVNDSHDEIDEIEVPASLIFKVARLLKDTQKIELIDSNSK